jgi:hypothetical protein
VDKQAFAPPREQGDRDRDLYAAVASTPTQCVEYKRLIAEVEVGLRLDTNLTCPRILYVAKVLPHAVVPPVDATDGCDRRMELDARIAASYDGLDIARVVRVGETARELYVSLSMKEGWLVKFVVAHGPRQG